MSTPMSVSLTTPRYQRTRGDVSFTKGEWDALQSEGPVTRWKNQLRADKATRRRMEEQQAGAVFPGFHHAKASCADLRMLAAVDEEDEVDERGGRASRMGFRREGAQGIQPADGRAWDTGFDGVGDNTLDMDDYIGEGYELDLLAAVNEGYGLDDNEECSSSAPSDSAGAEAASLSSTASKKPVKSTPGSYIHRTLEWCENQTKVAIYLPAFMSTITEEDETADTGIQSTLPSIVPASTITHTMRVVPSTSPPPSRGSVSRPDAVAPVQAVAAELVAKGQPQKKKTGGATAMLEMIELGMRGIQKVAAPAKGFLRKPVDSLRSALRRRLNDAAPQVLVNYNGTVVGREKRDFWSTLRDVRCV